MNNPNPFNASEIYAAVKSGAQLLADYRNGRVSWEDTKARLEAERERLIQSRVHAATTADQARINALIEETNKTVKWLKVAEAKKREKRSEAAKSAPRGSVTEGFNKYEVCREIDRLVKKRLKLIAACIQVREDHNKPGSLKPYIEQKSQSLERYYREWKKRQKNKKRENGSD